MIYTQSKIIIVTVGIGNLYFVALYVQVCGVYLNPKWIG